MNESVLYLVPSPLGPFQEAHFSAHFRETVYQLTYFVAERAKTARHFLKALGHPTPLPEIEIFEWGKYAEEADLQRFLHQVIEKKASLGMLSEAGAPGVADPGAALVRLAHERQLRVEPLIGPSSILLALMASGLNGQRFTFHGYLPVKGPERGKRIKRLEDQSRKFGETQIFIETPYRNGNMIKDLFQNLSEHTLLCIAADLTLPEQWIKTLSIKEWKRFQLPDLHKRPAVFLILNESQMLFKKYGKR